MRRYILFFFLLWAVLADAQPYRWVGTWACAPQPVDRRFMPFNNQMTDRSVRQVVKVSIGGDILRLQLSNEVSREPVEIASVYIAEAGASYQIFEHTATYLKFGGKRKVTIPSGRNVFSDPIRYHLKPLQRLSITINYVRAPKEPTVHMGSRTTTYILKGATRPSADFSKAFREDHWFNISAIDVADAKASAVAILGNSITDGKNSTTNAQNRWPDRMAESLYLMQHSRSHRLGKVGVLNLGIGNNRVLSVGLGSPGKERFERDVLMQRGVQRVIIFEGINDIGTSRDGLLTARRLIEAYKVMAAKAHALHMRVYGATITPMKGSGYYSIEHELIREAVNRWIRATKDFDAVIDFDELMRDPIDPHAMRRNWQSDWLHPNAEGYYQMGIYAARVLDQR